MRTPLPSPRSDLPALAVQPTAPVTLSKDRRPLALLAGAAALCAAMVSAPAAVSMQDVGEMTGIVGEGPRWLTRLEGVPTGSVHRPAGAGASRIVGDAMAVRAGTMLVPLQASAARASRSTRVNRSLKGDHVKASEPGPAMAAVSTPTARDLPATVPAPDGATLAQVTSAMSTMQTAALLHPHAALMATQEPAPVPVPPGTVIAAVVKKPAAKPPTRVAKARPAESSAESEPVVMARAYAPQGNRSANAFAALLRPGFPEAPARPRASEPEAVPAPALAPEADAQPEAAHPIPERVTRPSRRPKRRKLQPGRIVLAKGDHKWADDPLPRSVRAASQRRCLAAGVYHEARGERVAGQKAVAQVILNRVRNPAYPNTICGVVYQNQHRRNSCQFSFACDGIRDRIRSAKHWRTAKRIANDAIDGRFWLASVGSSTHYHADYVWPRWRRKMKRLTKIGRHIFYRTYRGGWS